MTYDSIKDLPQSITAVLPEGAQEIYRQTYNKIWNQVGEQPGRSLSRESLAHRQAWSAMQREYEQDFSTGKWHRKGEPVVAAKKEPRGLMPWLRHLFHRSSAHA